jgi:hypothetical protein
LKRIVIGLCGALLLSLAPVAAGAIKIDKIYFDSPGSDGGSNPSLNAEWIRLKNTGPSGRSLTNWTIRDKAGHVYRFGTYRLGAGKTVMVHTRVAAPTPPGTATGAKIGTCGTTTATARGSRSRTGRLWIPAPTRAQAAPSTAELGLGLSQEQEDRAASPEPRQGLRGREWRNPWSSSRRQLTRPNFAVAVVEGSILA